MGFYAQSTSAILHRIPPASQLAAILILHYHRILLVILIHPCTYGRFYLCAFHGLSVVYFGLIYIYRHGFQSGKHARNQEETVLQLDDLPPHLKWRHHYCKVLEGCYKAVTCIPGARATSFRHSFPRGQMGKKKTLGNEVKINFKNWCLQSITKENQGRAWCVGMGLST